MYGIQSDNGHVEVLEGIRIKTINYGKNMLMTEFLLQKDALLIEHSHPFEQTGYLVKGTIKLFIDGSERVLKPGDSWNIPSDVRHKAEILEDSIAIEVFNPCREDYLKFVNATDIS
jgi:quercetin dioxygenase-like cupin family protein